VKIEIGHEGSCLGATGGAGRLIVTTNLSFGEWSAVFRDATPTRLTPYQIHASQTGLGALSDDQNRADPGKRFKLRVC
jgi:hypothetical protein